jgi:hypothetical protein
MQQTDDDLVGIALTVACHVVARWRRADPAIEAQSFHHALHLLGDAGIRAEDPVLARLETPGCGCARLQHLNLAFTAQPSPPWVISATTYVMRPKRA